MLHFFSVSGRWRILDAFDAKRTIGPFELVAKFAKQRAKVKETAIGLGVGTFLGRVLELDYNAGTEGILLRLRPQDRAARPD